MNSILDSINKNKKYKTASILYKQDKLFKVILDMVCVKGGKSSILNNKIYEMTKKESKRLHECNNHDPIKVKINVALELYGFTKLMCLDDKCNNYNNYSNFIKKCITNKLIDDYRRSKMINETMVHEMECVDQEHELDDRISFNKRPREENNKKLLNLNGIKSEHDDIDTIVINNNIINIFKEFFDDEIVEVIVRYDNVRQALLSIVKEEEYPARRASFIRNKKKFKEFLRIKGIDYEDLF